MSNPRPTKLGALKIKLFSDVDLNELPKPGWDIEPILPENCVALLFGPSGSGKTFVALRLAYQVALGESPASGMAVQPGAVVYNLNEGRSGIVPRLHALKDMSGVDRDQLIEHGLYFVFEQIQLTKRTHIDGLIKAVREAGISPRLIVFDTLHRAFVGGDENSSQDMGRLMGGVDRLREEFGCSVLLVHHTGHEALDRARGSSALPAALHTSWHLEPAGGLLFLCCKKQKDAEEFDPIQVEMTQVGDSLVAHIVPDGEVYQKDLRDSDMHALHTLCEHLPDGARHGEWKDASELAPSTFNRVISRLMDRGHVEKKDGIYHPCASGKKIAGIAPPESHED